jgi:hypothetical protein
MVSIAGRVIGGTVSAAVAAPFFAVCGAFVGYVYAKLADLPANQAAKAWAVWSAAQTALATFSQALVEGKLAKACVTTTVSVITTAIGINELQKRGLIGHKMIVFFAVMQVFSVIGLLAQLTSKEEVQG